MSFDLQNAPEYLSLTSETNKIGYWYFSFSRNLFELSSYTKDILGLSAEKKFYSTEDLAFILTAENLDILKLRFQNLKEGQANCSTDISILSQSGEKKWLRFCYKVKYEGSKLENVFGSLQDVTLKKNQKDNLVKKELRAQSALYGAGLGTWDWNLVNNNVYYDERWYEIIGLKPEAANSDFSIFQQNVHPEDLPQIFEEINKHLEGKTDQYAVNFRMKHISGHWVHIQARGKITERDQEGKPVRFSGTHLDISESVAQEMKLKTLAQVLDKAPMIVAMAKPDGNAIYVNEIGKSVWGKLTSQSIQAAHPPEEFKRIKEECIPTAIAHGIWQGETKILDSANREITVEQIILSHKNVKGEVEMLSTIVTDLTQRNAEKAKLLNASRLASLGEMAGGIAHEINNPLAIIHGKSQRLKAKLSEKVIAVEECIKDIEKIEATATRIAKIIRGMRAVARNGEKDPFQSASVKTIIDDSLSLSIDKFRNKGVEIRLREFKEQYMECRSTQITQILINLLNNSYDAVLNLEDKWIEIDVKDRITGLEISITDSGKGITKDLATKIMNPFFTTKDVGKGTGLGLSISSGIVQDHGGRLWLDSNSKNTRFVILLPKKQPVSNLQELPKAA